MLEVEVKVTGPRASGKSYVLEQIFQALKKEYHVDIFLGKPDTTSVPSESYKLVLSHDGKEDSDTFWLWKIGDKPIMYFKTHDDAYNFVHTSFIRGYLDKDANGEYTFILAQYRMYDPMTSVCYHAEEPIKALQYRLK